MMIYYLQVLEELESSGGSSNQLGINLMERLLLVAEAALCWGHMSPLLPKRLAYKMTLSPFKKGIIHV